MSKSSILGAVSGVGFSLLVFASGSLMVDPPGRTASAVGAMQTATAAGTEAPATVAPVPVETAEVATSPDAAHTSEATVGGGGASEDPEMPPVATTATATPDAPVAGVVSADAPPMIVAAVSEPVAAPGSDAPASTAVTLPVTDDPRAEPDGNPASASAVASAEVSPKGIAGATAMVPTPAAAPTEPAPPPPADAMAVTAPSSDARAANDTVADQPTAALADAPLTNVSGAGMDRPPAPDAATAALPKVEPQPASDAAPAPTTLGDLVAKPDTATSDTAPSGVATLKIGSSAPTGALVLVPGAKAAASDLPKVVTLVPSRDGPVPPDAALPEGGASTNPETGETQPGLGRAVAGVKVLRLGGGTSASLPAPAAEAGAKSQAEAGPLRRYAASFANPENKPLLGILIFDEGVSQGGLDSAALASIPFPVTIAIDPEREGASSVAATYHAAGAEVAMLVGDLPDGSTPSDVEVAYQSFTAALPNSVALVGRPGSGMVKGGLAAEHVTALLAADGRGLITYDAGLNDGRRAAQKAGLPNAVIEKVLGPSEDNDGTVARELDRAAFMANQKGASVVAITATPEAITSLVAWATGPGSASVALAPVSAVMMVKPK